jgi:PAS domain S-box-containing protein
MKTNLNPTANSTTAVGVVFQLADGTIQSCNVAAENILGYTAEQLIGASAFEPPWRTIHQDGSPFHPETYPAIASIKTGLPYSDVVMGYYQPNGNLIWLSINTQPLSKTNNTELYGVEVTFIDITQDLSAGNIPQALPRKRLSEQKSSVARDITNRQPRSITLFESEQRLRLATNASGIGMWFWDLVESTLEWTEQGKATFGLSLDDELSYETFFKMLHPEDRDRTQSAIDQALANHTEYRVEYRVIWSNGSVHWIIAKGKGFYNHNGNPVRMMGTVQDISDRKELEQQLIQQTKDLTNANRLKDEFLAIVSHELRTPLNPILGWAQMLSAGKLNAAKTAMGIEIIERNAKLQAQLIEDLLDVSRILRGKLNLNKIPLNLESIIRAALTTVQLAAEAKSIQIETRYEPNIGQVLGDAGRLQQIVWNLVSNAIKFTDEGGRVTITLERLEQYASIQVQDNGRGIESEFLPYVFEHFRQSDSSSSRKFGGLGLGLAIVRHLTELHGGTVVVLSPGLGQGATFKLKLPLINTPITDWYAKS